MVAVMDQNLSLIKALVNTLHIEIDTLDDTDGIELDEPVNLVEKVRDYETKIIKAALIQTGGNQRRAARLLSIKTSTLNTKIKHLGIDLLRHNPPEPNVRSAAA
jgi:DNA-binding NtrC family response regulator